MTSKHGPYRREVIYKWQGAMFTICERVWGQGHYRHEMVCLHRDEAKAVALEILNGGVK
jgi:hypothetical protein